jgi:hypothetical protein
MYDDDEDGYWAHMEQRRQEEREFEREMEELAYEQAMQSQWVREVFNQYLTEYVGGGVL